MQDYETEEQQLEALKKWWKENSSSLFFGLAIGLAGIFGWQYYGEYTEDRAFQASNLYTSISQQVKQGEFTDVNKLDQLRADFADTPYAAMAAMIVASYDYEKGNVTEAISQLQWAIKNSVDANTRHLASIRLAAVYLSEKKYDEADSLLAADYPDAFAARILELKGDMYAAQGNNQAARESYDKALTTGATGSPWIQLKRNNVGSSNKLSDQAEPVS